MPAKVLAVSQAAELGGAEYMLLRLARLLPERGFEMELTVPAEGGLLHAARREGLPVHVLPVGRLRRGAWARAIASWPRARRLVRELRPDLACLNGSVAQRLAPAFPGSVPIVPYIHDLLEFVPRAWSQPRFWDRAGPVLCASKAVEDSLAALGVPRDRLRTVFAIADPAEPAPRPDWADGRPAVGYVGMMEPRKGTLDLLRAFPRVVERHPAARLVVVGKDAFGASPDYASAVREEARGLGDRVLMLGAVDEAPRLMPWFDVLAVPSHTEPFGTVAAEALAAGTPAVVTASGGMAEYVVTGRNGAVVPPGDIGALGAAIADVLDHPGDFEAAAREDAARFAGDRVVDDVAEAFRQALERRR